MDNETSAIEKSKGAKKEVHASAIPKHTTEHKRIDIRMVLSGFQIWLDNSIDEQSNADCGKTVAELRHVVNTINTFTDDEQGVEFIKSMNNEKAWRIISS